MKEEETFGSTERGAARFQTVETSGCLSNNKRRERRRERGRRKRKKREEKERKTFGSIAVSTERGAARFQTVETSGCFSNTLRIDEISLKGFCVRRGRKGKGRGKERKGKAGKGKERKGKKNGTHT